MFQSKDRMTSEVKENIRGGNGAVTFNHVFTAQETFNKARLCAVLEFPPGASMDPMTILMPKCIMFWKENLR